MKIASASAKRVLFLGSKALGLTCLESIVQVARNASVSAITIDDRSDCRSVFDKFKEYCRASGTPLLVASNAADADRIILEEGPNLILVCGWYWLIGREALGGGRWQVMGVHNSLLPRYRGSSPLVWAIINGERQTGFSLFSLEEKMDEGKIWAQRRVRIDANDDVGTVLSRIEGKLLVTLKDILPKIIAGTAKSRAQANSHATYCARRLPDDGEIDWSSSAQQVHNFVRAQSHPYPGAFTWKAEEMIKVWKTRLLTSRYFGTPGQVAFIRNDGVVVVCGDGRAVLLETIEDAKGVRPARLTIGSIKTRFPRRPLLRGLAETSVRA